MRKLHAGAVLGILALVGVVWALATGHLMLAIAGVLFIAALVVLGVGLIAAADPEGRGGSTVLFCLICAAILLLCSAEAAWGADGTSMAIPSLASNYGGFYLAGLFGMVAHFGVKWAKNEVTDTLVGYFFKVFNRRTFATLVALAVAEATAFATGTLDAATLQTILSMGFLAGYGLDSAVNKGSPPAQ